ncbi:Rhamnogalacturonan endolyase YesW precursor [compost metagenome]
MDGVGKTIGNASADYRNSSGYILSGPEFLTVFKGSNGEALTTVNYEPPRGTVSDWGDSYGNRVDRFLAGVAYLDGQRPSFVMARGYYTRTVLVAYNWRDGKLTKLWTFDSNASGNSAYAGQGNHSLSVADVDNDGKDEIIYGSAVIDDNGKGIYTTGLGHGDALHVSDLDPDRAGLEVFGVHESTSAAYGAEIHNAATGQIYWGIRTGADTGRGLAADIDPRTKGTELWASGIGLHSVKGVKISDATPNSTNFAIWWDGDLLRELLDHTGGTGKIDKWNYSQSTTQRLLTATGTASNNSTKGNPSLQADIFGDWREEAIWRTADNTALRIYTTTDVTPHRIYTLMHDPVYRLSVAWQNVAYNQPPHTGFYLGDGMSSPPKPNIYLPGN